MDSPTNIIITIRDILRFLFKWWWTIFLINTVVVAAVTGLIYLAPQIYTAKSAVLIESIQAIATQSNPMPGVDMDVALNTEIEILKARPVISATVEKLALDKIPPKETGFSGLKRSLLRSLASVGLVTLTDEKENWIVGLLDKIKVKAIPRSNVLEVRFAYRDPDLAAAIVNTLTDEYVKHHVAVYTASDVGDSYFRQVAETEARLADLASKLAAARAKYATSASPEASLTVIQNAGNLRDQESRLRAELVDLRAKYADSHEKVVVAEHKLALVRSQVKVAEVRLLEIDRIQDEVASIESRIQAQRESYRRLVALMESAAMTKSATSGTTNVRIVEYSSIPASPDIPRLLFIAAACFGGFGLAVGVALVREYFDQRVDRVDVAEEILGRPILAVVPVYRPGPGPGPRP